MKRRRVKAFDIAIKNVQKPYVNADIGRGKKRLVVGYVVSNISKAKSIEFTNSQNN